MGTSSGKGQHRLDGSEHDSSWAGVMRQEIEAERAKETARPPRRFGDLSGPGGEPIGGLAYAIPPSRPANFLVVEREVFKRAAADYNRERAAAYQAFKMASDAAWSAYHTAMRTANKEYERAVTAAAEHYDTTMAHDGK